METITEKEEEKEARNKIVPILKGSSLFFDIARFEHAQRVAQVFAKSTMVPEQFQNNLANCIIALNLSERLQVDPFMLMQNMYIVHGRPGIEAKLAIGLINQNGRFSELEYEMTGEGDNSSCRAYAKKISTGKVLYGPKVDIAMAKAEGWYNKPGSKWKTIPELMLQYRAAMFFARTYCPDILLGMLTREELQDVIDITPIKHSLVLEPVEQPKITEKTYQPMNQREDIEEQVASSEEHIRQLIDSFKHKSKKGILEFHEEHKSEFLTWPDKAFDAWCSKFHKSVGIPYAEWIRRPLEKEEEKEKPEIETKEMGTVVCPTDGEHKPLAFCENARGKDKPCERFAEQDCLARWPE